MSTPHEGDLDLELHFLPAWAQEAPDPNRYSKYAGESARDERRGDRPFRRGDSPGGRPRTGPGNRPAPRRDGGPRPARFGQNERGDRRAPGGGRPPERTENRVPATPLPEINLAFRPDDKGVESLAKQIKITGRAYPLFDIAQMILRKPERHSVIFTVRKKADGQPAQALYVCALDDSLWLSEDEAVRYVLDKFFSTFYQAEKTQIEAPKGTYTFVAQCGMSGVILGPPNYHDYQNQLRKLHAERFARMPFDAFKARVKIVRDEAVVKKWLDDQSWKTEFVCLNLPEPLKLATREDVEKHFRETHLSNMIKQVDTFQMTGTVSRNLQSPPLMRLVRHTWEEQKRFPLQIATVLSQQFATHGLQFFKVNKTVTHVSVARPHYLDLQAAPVSDGIKRIVDYLNATPKCSRRRLIEGLLPGQMAPAPPKQTTNKRAPENPESAAVPAPEPAGEPEPSPEVTALVSDLHWLIHQGHVIEFANGLLETAKKPLPRPEKPARPEAKKPGAGTETPTPASITASGDVEHSSPMTEEMPSQDSPATEPPGNANEANPQLSNENVESAIVEAPAENAAPEEKAV